MLVSSYITDCIGTFESKISILCIIFHDRELYFISSLSFLKFVKIREFYEF